MSRDENLERDKVNVPQAVSTIKDSHLISRQTMRTERKEKRDN
jgi:hypothetical protein